MEAKIKKNDCQYNQRLYETDPGIGLSHVPVSLVEITYMTPMERMEAMYVALGYLTHERPSQSPRLSGGRRPMDSSLPFGHGR
jgi:hypothetical protein